MPKILSPYKDRTQVEIGLGSSGFLRIVESIYNYSVMECS